MSVSPNCHLGDRRNFPTPSVCMNPSFIISCISPVILFPVCLGSGSPQSGRRSDSAPSDLDRRELTYKAPPPRDQEETAHFIPTAPSVLHSIGHKRHQVSPHGHHPPGDQEGTTPAPMVPARMDSAREQMEKSKASQVLWDNVLLQHKQCLDCFIYCFYCHDCIPEWAVMSGHPQFNLNLMLRT